MMNSIIKNKYLYIITGIFFIFLIWEIASVWVNNNYLLPSVSSTLKALGTLFSEKKTYQIFSLTILRLLISVTLSFFISLIFAIISMTSRKLEYFLKPTVSLFKALPLAVLIVLLLFWLKENAIYYIVGVVVFPILYEGILNGMKNIDSNVVDDIRTLSNNNLFVIAKIYLPLSFPFFFTALLQSFGLGLKVLVMAEYISQPQMSIGREFIVYKDITMEMEFVFAWSIILIIFVLLIDEIVSYISNKVKNSIV